MIYQLFQPNQLLKMKLMKKDLLFIKKSNEIKQLNISDDNSILEDKKK